MSRYPDPCYCDQAREYEDFIKKIIYLLPDWTPKGKKSPRDKALALIKKYQDAQKQYEDED